MSGLSGSPAVSAPSPTSRPHRAKGSRSRRVSLQLSMSGRSRASAAAAPAHPSDCCSINGPPGDRTEILRYALPGSSWSTPGAPALTLIALWGDRPDSRARWRPAAKPLLPTAARWVPPLVNNTPAPLARVPARQPASTAASAPAAGPLATAIPGPMSFPSRLAKRESDPASASGSPPVRCRYSSAPAREVSRWANSMTLNAW